MEVSGRTLPVSSATYLEAVRCPTPGIRGSGLVGRPKEKGGEHCVLWQGWRGPDTHPRGLAGDHVLYKMSVPRSTIQHRVDLTDLTYVIPGFLTVDLAARTNLKVVPLLHW